MCYVCDSVEHKLTCSCLFAAFGSLECPDIEELCDVPEVTASVVRTFCGKHKGIQGHHNSCYLDSTLFR